MRRTLFITLPEDSGKPSKLAPRVFKLRIKKAGEINPEVLRRFLDGKRAMNNECLTAIMVLDVLIRYQPSLIYSTVGRSFFTRENYMSLGGGAEVWQGYYQSARPTKGRMMINLDVSATAYYEPIPLYQMVAKILGRRSVDDFRGGLSDRDRLRVEKAIKGLKIKVNHRGESSRQWKIMKLTPTSADRTVFDLGETGEKSDVASYFLKTYNKWLAYPFLPCVAVRKGTFLPMEVCEVVPGQRHIKKLNERQTAEMIKFTCQRPHERLQRIMNGVKTLEYDRNEYLKAFGMRIGRDNEVVNARVLPVPKVIYHKRSREAIVTPSFGVWNLRNKMVAEGATLKSWGVVCFAQPRDVPIGDIQRFVTEMCVTFQDTGMNVQQRQPPIMHADPNGNIEATLRELYLRTGNAVNYKPQILMCILPNTGVSLYGEVKRVADCIVGVNTQCIQAKHVRDVKKQYCANVCLKVNLKLGGTNSYIEDNDMPFLADGKSILFGADVTHPAPGDTTKPSIAAVCASMDTRASRYAAEIRVQPSRLEIIEGLAEMCKELLKKYYASTKIKPSRILFYRDGVSEGQFAEVMRSEVAAVRAACATLDKDYKPAITFVVIQKRHHARFFPLDRRDADKTGNCLPGTVIESGITHPTEFDFYLQSHAGLQGTSRPAHYQVLVDENKFTPDQLQDLTYKLCYLYGRATRAVSICPPAYYSHLVAFRARFHSKGESWSESDLTSEKSAGGAEQIQLDTIQSYGKVHSEVSKYMYFM
ncbi:hypothetical protein BZG36_04506 [Bifiguratus adelaidae]|uniref:Piwi domain-containing protein n=1 Tax=Bifiguratus adelaidae TaxID=1938954 RepID=A0A261XW52_9FUNG|nr:hypothetical protein BZG36_04506 [Bifiguratus adelaidae]